MSKQSTDCRPDPDCCNATAFARSTVSVPVAVTPYMDTSAGVQIRCNGNAIISDVEADCEETGGISFVISQRICVEMPFCFTAAVEFGDTELSNCRVGLGGCRPYPEPTE
ncbi:MAG: hypothetical protein GX572_05975 [Clostridia bacterium]|nr:hypothetical protein [Clostridia bacterium]